MNIYIVFMPFGPLRPGHYKVSLLLFQNELEFHVDHCMDLMKAGVEAIIEDQVTSVFEAEELRSWNLLTRTNRSIRKY